MGVISLTSAVLCTLAFLINQAMRPRTDAVLLSLALMASAAVYTILSHTSPWPQDVWQFALVDLVVGLFAFICWRTKRAEWKRLLYRLIVAQLVWHCMFWAAWYQVPDALHGRISYLYAAGLNVLGFAQIACGAWPGVSDVAAHVLRRLPGGAGGRSSVGAAN